MHHFGVRCSQFLPPTPPSATRMPEDSPPITPVLLPATPVLGYPHAGGLLSHHTGVATDHTGVAQHGRPPSWLGWGRAALAASSLTATTVVVLSVLALVVILLVVIRAPAVVAVAVVTIVLLAVAAIGPPPLPL